MHLISIKLKRVKLGLHCIKKNIEELQQHSLFYWVKLMWMPHFKNGISIKWWDTHMFHRIKEEGLWVSVKKRALLVNSLLESCIEEINIRYNSKFGHKVAHWSPSQKVWQIYSFAQLILLCHESKQQEWNLMDGHFMRSIPCSKWVHQCPSV